MISLRDVALSRGGRVLVESVSIQIHPGQKIGLVGANGCGKSTLLAALRGEVHPDRGDIDAPGHWVLAHVSQDLEIAERSAIDYVLDGDAALRAAEAEIERAEATHDGVAIAHAHERMREIDGYSARARAATLLAGLGVDAAQFDTLVEAFSGGWRERLHLGRALMCRSDVLLLDEPTNHLDLDAVLWLEQWLKSYRGALVVVSHDREFLDGVVDTVASIEAQHLRVYRGNYSAFERQRAAALAQREAMRESQRRRIAHLESFIERFRAKATKASQAQSRIKALARLEEIAPAHADSPFSFEFREAPASPDPLLVLEDVAAGYDGRAVLAAVSLVIRPGSRLGLLGRNGAGKSTLVKVLAGALAPLAGVRREGRGLRIGYFAQHQLESLRPDETPLWHLSRADATAREQALRDYLGRFGFGGEAATIPVATLSGGERSRLALALIAWQAPNLLLLDEPTNHLDLEARESLTEALQEFEGAVVVVSHDRHLLRTTADSLWLIDQGTMGEFDQDLDGYARWLSSERERAAAAPAQARADRQKARQVAAAERQVLLEQRRTIRRELDKVETQLASWQRERAELERALADPGAYDTDRREGLGDKFRRQSWLAETIAQAEERWLELTEEWERLTAAVEAFG